MKKLKDMLDVNLNNQISEQVNKTGEVMSNVIIGATKETSSQVIGTVKVLKYTMYGVLSLVVLLGLSIIVATTKLVIN